ncbi:pyrroline-5-carboxylate reductase [Acidocella sp.]|uniref:pyrroline-5-carboxylate reductase n=1 Tax=Acidocella sp. TaxID=50710 RepID=UPI003CFD8811
MTALPSLLLIGGGRMGSALLAGWREQGLSQAFVIDPSPGAQSLAGPGVTVLKDASQLPAGFMPEAVVLAVKPQMADGALPAYGRFAATALFISIMAGKTVRGVAGLLGGAPAIVRAMPNTPAAVRQGITVAFAGAEVSSARRDLAARLLAAVGEVAWVEEEAMLDPVTAISGGGPAYVFLLTELLEQAGLDQGLPAGLARIMARQTVIGSAGLLAASSETPEALRVAVTSPGGTTAEALKLLRADDALPKIFKAAIQAATERSRELSA